MDYVRHESRLEVPSNKIVLQVEVWQSQNYWPIKGWGSPLSGTPHFTSVLLPPTGTENFPDELSPPPGWDWADRWAVDISSRYGQPDTEGWFYAATFDRLVETIKTGVASGVTTKTSMVRKRRWVRTILCTSPEVCERIKQRVDRIMEMRTNIEAAMKNKEEAFKAVKFYEENRSFVFAQSLHLATQGTLNTLAVLKELGNKLKLFKMYLHDRITMERDFAKRMEGLGHKYWSQFSMRDAGGNSAQGPKLLDQSYVLMSPSKQNELESSFMAANAGGEGDENRSILHCADVFFSKVFLAAQAKTNIVNDYTTNLMQIISDEIEQMLIELQAILKESRAVFRKNSDICRLSEAAIRNFLSCVGIAFESSTQSSLKEISILSEELHGLKGGIAYNPIYFTNVKKKSKKKVSPPSPSQDAGVIDFSDDYDSMSSSTLTSSSAGKAPPAWSDSLIAEYLIPGEPLSIAALHVASTSFAIGGGNSTVASGTMAHPTAVIASAANFSNRSVVQTILSTPREDMWLSIQRYKTAVRDSQEALCVLIAESMDLELQRQIIANRVHHLFTNAIRSYAKQELSLFAEIHGTWTKLMKDCLYTIKENGLPYPVLQSPFTKLNPILDIAASSASSKEGQEQAAAAQEQLDEEFMNNIGIFSFTKLFTEPLPECPGVVKSSEMLCASTHDFLRSRNALFDGIWKTVYLIATSDGYLHVIQSNKCDIPDRSFYLKQCLINENLREPRHRDLWKFVFEISYSPVILQQEKNKHIYSEGLFFRPADETAHEQWLSSLLELTSSTVHVDKEVEQEAQQAMMEALPILRGETEKMDLELKKYEDLTGGGSTSTAAETVGTSTTGEAEVEGDQYQQEAASVTEEVVSSQSATPAHIPQQQEETPQVPVVGEDEDTSDEEDNDAQPVSSNASFQSPSKDTDGDRSTTNSPIPGDDMSTPISPANSESGKYEGDTKKSLTPFGAVGNVKNKAAAFKNGSSLSLKKESETGWKKKDTSAVGTALPPMRTAKVVGLVPVADIKPKQIIPVVDNSKVPLARRHSQLIAQYEMGLKKEKEKQTSRVAETRGKRLKDFALDEEDELEDGVSETGATPEQSPVHISQQPRKPVVRALSQRFDPNALHSPASIGTPQHGTDGTSRSNSPIRPREELSSTEIDREGNKEEVDNSLEEITGTNENELGL